MAETIFTPLPDKPDHPALEVEVLDWWEGQGTFEQLRERNRGGPKFSLPSKADVYVGEESAPRAAYFVMR